MNRNLLTVFYLLSVFLNISVEGTTNTEQTSNNVSSNLSIPPRSDTEQEDPENSIKNVVSPAAIGIGIAVAGATAVGIGSEIKKKRKNNVKDSIVKLFQTNPDYPSSLTRKYRVSTDQHEYNELKDTHTDLAYNILSQGYKKGSLEGLQAQEELKSHQEKLQEYAKQNSDKEEEIKKTIHSTNKILKPFISKEKKTGSVHLS